MPYLNLRTVTFTGVDDKTDLQALADLALEYPFAEWGMLISIEKTGKNPRYPSLSTMEAVGDALLGGKSIHLCGKLARNAANGSVDPIAEAYSLAYGVHRIQINLGKAIDDYPDAYIFMRRNSQMLPVQMILQTYAFDSPIVRKSIAVDAYDPVFLHDASGGRGKEGQWQIPINRNFVGFAGGISPENVKQKITDLAGFHMENPFWIDMETGVRTDDWFDMAKVRRVLEIVKPYVRNEVPHG